MAEANDLLRGAVIGETDFMGSQLTTLTSSGIERFERDGYVVVRQAFPRADALAMKRRWWREIKTRTAYAGTTGPAGARSRAT